MNLFSIFLMQYAKKAKRKDGRKVEKKGESVKKYMSLLADLQRDEITTLPGFSFTAASINI